MSPYICTTETIKNKKMKTYIFDIGTENIEIVAESFQEAENEVYQNYEINDCMILLETINSY